MRASRSRSASQSISKRSRDVGEADRRRAVDAERAPRIPRAFRDHPAGTDAHPHRGRDRTQRHAGAGDQRLEQHVRRAGQLAGAARRGMQPGAGLAAPGRHGAGDLVGFEPGFGAGGDAGGAGIVAIALLQRRLHRPQLLGVHPHPPRAQAEFRGRPEETQTPRPLMPARRRPTMAGRYWFAPPKPFCQADFS